MEQYDFTKKDIVNSLKEIGLKEGDSIFIHSNLGFFGRLQNIDSSGDYCKIFKDAIFDVIGKNGTTLDLDKNALKNKNKNYFVRSLYFDNEIYSNFYEKVDGMETRKKFRIRVYSSNEKSKSPIFLEMKGRQNQRTYKLRTEIDKSHVTYLINNENLDSLLKIYSSQNNVVNHFIFDE